MPSALRIDAHQHFWRLSNPWTNWPTPDLGVIFRDYEPADLESQIKKHNVEGTILVQAAPSAEETEDLLLIAGATDFVKGVVGWVDFENLPTALADLDRFDQSPLFVGVRPMLQAIEKTNWLLDPTFELIFSSLIERGLCFDALAQPRHLNSLCSLSKRYPDLKIVIDHAAKPFIGERRIEPWADQLQQLASSRNVVCKLSGLVTEARPEDTAEDLRPYFDVMLDVFGPQRIMWGSDWPVVDLAGGYGRWIEITSSLLEGLSPGDKSAIWRESALQIYGLQSSSASNT